MKFLIIIVLLAVGSVAVIPKPKDITGTWVLETSEKNTEAAILRIKMSEGYFEGTIDIPGQQVYDYPVWIQLNKNKIKIILDDKGACFIEGVVSDSVLAGRSVVTGKSSGVKFRRVKI